MVVDPFPCDAVCLFLACQFPIIADAGRKNTGDPEAMSGVGQEMFVAPEAMSGVG